MLQPSLPKTLRGKRFDHCFFDHCFLVRRDAVAREGLDQELPGAASTFAVLRRIRAPVVLGMWTFFAGDA